MPTRLKAISSLCYAPPVWVWAMLAREGDKLFFEQWEHHQKGTWRNACLVDGANGPQLLAIPLRKGKHQQMPVRDVQIAYDAPWPVIHWRTLVSAYGSAPYFPHYRDSLERLFQQRDNFLWDWNLRLFYWMKEQWALPGEMVLTAHFEPRWGDSGPDLRGLRRRDFTPPSGLRAHPYPQVFEDRHPFFPGLSGLDLLFCAGPEAPRVLMAMQLPDFWSGSVDSDGVPPHPLPGDDPRGALSSHPIDYSR